MQEVSHLERTSSGSALEAGAAMAVKARAAARTVGSEGFIFVLLLE